MGMATAYRTLGLVALFSGVAAIVLPVSAEGSAFFKYFFGIVLLLSAGVLIRGGPAENAVPTPLVRDPGPEVEDLVQRGEIIPAIKRYRELYGVGLKEAKDAVDAIRARLRGVGP